MVSFLDTDKILKEHIDSMSKEKGPMQPPLDLRNIALKSMDFSSSSSNNHSTENTQKPVRRRFKNPPPLPIPAWADALSKKYQSNDQTGKSQKTPEKFPDLSQDRPETPNSTPSTPKAPSNQKKKKEKEDKEKDVSKEKSLCEPSKEKKKKEPKQKTVPQQTPPAKKIEPETVIRTPTPKSQSQSPVPSKTLPDLLNHSKPGILNPPKKTGKTPGRERKIKEHNHTNPFPQPVFETSSSSVPPSPDDVAEYKSNAFQFSSPLEMDDVHDVISNKEDPWNLDLSGYKENKDLGPIVSPITSQPVSLQSDQEVNKAETVPLDDYKLMFEVVKYQHELIQNLEWNRTQQNLAEIRNQNIPNSWNSFQTPVSNISMPLTNHIPSMNSIPLSASPGPLNRMPIPTISTAPNNINHLQAMPATVPTPLNHLQTISGTAQIPMNHVPVANMTGQPLNSLNMQQMNNMVPMMNGNMNNLNINRVAPPPGLERLNRTLAQNSNQGLFNDGTGNNNNGSSGNALNNDRYNLSAIWSADWKPNNNRK
uniref:Uncharacterized protein n=1 Tax=Megaselia scalaris TaxID=36166 RepID=T1GRA1_MEGSC